MFYIEVYFQSVLQNSYKIESGTYVIGRSETADIYLRNKGVSNIHAVLQLKDDELYISDLNSTNSTMLNNQKITGEQVLQLGDTLIISKYVLKINDWAANVSSTPSSSNMQIKGNDFTVVAQLAKDYQEAYNSPDSYVLVDGDKKKQKKLLLFKSIYRIGAARDSDIQLQLDWWNFFTPKYIAEIMRIGEVFYIVPLKKSYVSVNGRLINNSLRLKDDDKIRIKKLMLRFINEAS